MEWIRCDSKLPDIGAKALIYLKIKKIYVAEHISSGWWRWLDKYGIMPEDVTHWMPLLEPPKEDENKMTYHLSIIPLWTRVEEKMPERYCDIIFTDGHKSWVGELREGGFYALILRLPDPIAYKSVMHRKVDNITHWMSVSGR